jgi:hypothetical protein
MYLRTTRRKNKDGSVVEYVQLAHNYRDPVTRRPKPHIVANLGRIEAVDRPALRRLVHSINRFLGPEDELKGKALAQGGEALHFLEGRPMGAGWLLWGLWEKLDIGATLLGKAKARRFSDPAAEVARVFAMVANRALSPLSKYATPAWLSGNVYLPEVPEDVYDEQLYRAMDFLLGVGDEIQQAVFFRCADLLNLEVDLLLYDTTSIYVEMEDDDTELLERQAAWADYDAGQGPEPWRPRPQVLGSQEQRGDFLLQAGPSRA